MNDCENCAHWSFLFSICAKRLKPETCRNNFLPLTYLCEVCKRKFKKRKEVHTQANNSEIGFRYICCECLGHKSLSCM